MGPDDIREHLRRAYRRLLNPLVRILIRNGVTSPEMEEWVRQVFVDAATSEEFQLPGRRLSDTRLAILTGLSRKEIHRLRTQGGRSNSESTLSRVGRVITGWTQDPDFTGPYGLPLSIPFEERSDVDAPSFTELVRRYSGDMAPRAMLDELLRTGLAEVDDDGLIKNTGRAYIPSKLDPAAIEQLGKAIARLADTLDFNSQAESPAIRRFQRYVVTDFGLTEQQYEQFNNYLKEKCQNLLETLDNWIATQEGRFTGKQARERVPKKKITAGVSIYHFVDERLPFEDEYDD